MAACGVHLFTPFLIEGTDMAILVNWDWIPDADYAAGNAYDSDAGMQTIKGYVARTRPLAGERPMQLCLLIRNGTLSG